MIPGVGPGVGKVLALVIMYETGEIGRFASSGNYVSCCRCVRSERLSNGKKKGTQSQMRQRSSRLGVRRGGAVRAALR